MFSGKQQPLTTEKQHFVLVGFVSAFITK